MAKKDKIKLSDYIGRRISILYENGVKITGVLQTISKGVVILSKATLINNVKEVFQHPTFTLVISKVSNKGIKIFKKQQ